LCRVGGKKFVGMVVGISVSGTQVSFRDFGPYSDIAAPIRDILVPLHTEYNIREYSVFPFRRRIHPGEEYHVVCYTVPASCDKPRPRMGG